MAGHGSIPYFNVTVDREDILQDAMRVFAAIRPAWTLEDMKTQNFSDGYMNRMMAFSQSSDKDLTDAIVLRVYGDLNHVYNTFSREREFHIMQIAHAADAFPRLLAVFDNGVVYKYFPGKPLKHEQFFDTNVIRTMSHKLASLHAQDPASLKLLGCEGVPSPFDPQPSLRTRVAHCAAIMPERLLDQEKDKRYQELRMSEAELLSAFDALDSTLQELGLPMCVSHGDLHMKNTVYDEHTGDVILVDYEMSGIQYEATDLAYIFSFRPLQDMLGALKPSDPVFTPEVRAKWLRAYVEAKYKLQGRNPGVIPDDLLQLADVEHQLVEHVHIFMKAGTIKFLCLLYIMLIQMSTEFATIFPGDHLGALSTVKSKWEQGQKNVDSLKQKYLELKKECERQNHL